MAQSARRGETIGLHLVLPGRGRMALVAVAIHHVLDTQEGVAGSLEHAADLEGPGDRRRRGEEPEHLHGVTGQPAGQD